MSGHSKWAQIKRQKGANDTKRGLAFTKLSAAITIAVKQGGGIGDPNQNFKLRMAVDAARAQSMPKENIERAIARASGKDAAVMEETMYEGFGPHGVSIIVEAATDNKNRTTGDVANIFNKNGGNMGQPGSVSYQFKHVGRVIVEKNNKSLDDIFMLAVDAGAEDIEEVEEEVFVYTAPGSLNKVREALSGLTIKEVELMWKPLTTVEIADEGAQQKVINLLDKLEELDDVQKVFSNFDIK
jgi:YebC/PmpR family DNA-binding regulatory protein